MVLRRTYPDASDYWDGNWLSTKVSVRSRGLSGTVASNTRAEEYREFLGALVLLYETLEGSAEFSTMEEWLTMKVYGDALGHIAVDVELRDTSVIGNQLCCCLEMDQSYLKSAIASLQELVEKFPIKGNRHAAP